MTDITRNASCKTDERSQGIDALRALAALLVVIGHSRAEVLEGCPYLTDYWAANLQWYMRILSWMSVPIFLMITGSYFHTFDSWQRILKAEKQLGWLYLIMVGLLLGFYVPLWTQSEGGFPDVGRIYHEILAVPAMWYLRDMAIVLPLLFVVKRRWPGGWIYYTIIPLTLINYWLCDIKIGPFSFTLWTLPFLVMGMWVHHRRELLLKALDVRRSALIFVASLMMGVAEVAVYIHLGVEQERVFLLSTSVSVLAVFMLGLQPGLRWSRRLGRMGREYSALIYVVHITVVAIVVYMFEKTLGKLHWAFFPINIIVSYAGTIALIAAWRRCVAFIKKTNPKSQANESR